MATRSKALPAGTARQRVTTPAGLAFAVRRGPKKPHLTASLAPVQLAERGGRAETKAEENLRAAYRNFVGADSHERKSEAGRDLIRHLFGKAKLQSTKTGLIIRSYGNDHHD